MVEIRPKHAVSTKAVLLNPDRTAVLGMKYFYEDATLYGYGLPGGHLEDSENPDEAVIREVEEELGIIVSNLERFHFTPHKDGKIVLMYHGILSQDVELLPSNPKREIGEWVAIQDIVDQKVDFESYTEGILKALQC